jgi:integrase/recombinase XerC
MEYLTKPELRALMSVAHDHNKTHHLFLCMSLWHATRVSEALAIQGRDIQSGLIAIGALKGGNDDLPPIHIDSDPLFDCGPILAIAQVSPGRIFNFSRQRADEFIKRYAAIAGIHPKKAHMHALRHSMAMLLWEKTHNLGMIQSYLRHKDPSSTMRYLVESDKQKAQIAVAGITI